MNFNPYKRNNYIKDKESEKILSNEEVIFDLTHKEEFHTKKEEQKTRLTGDKGNLSKNKPVIIHSNSTKKLKPFLNKAPQSLSKEKNVNIININVNNLIINNNIENSKNSVNNINIVNKNPKNKINNMFSKLGGDIIKNDNNKKVKKNEKNIILDKVRTKSQIKPIKNNNIHLINKNNIFSKKLSKEKYNSGSSNIQGIIDNLIQATKSPPYLFCQNESNLNNNKQSLLNNNTLELANENNNTNNNIDENKNDNNLNQNEPIKTELNEDNMEIHFKYWEILLTMELHSENKLGLHTQVNKLLELIEKEFCSKPIKLILNIFKNEMLNFCYKKILKISFAIITYIKFLLIDFNYEMTIKANVKKLLSNINENLLILISSQLLIKDNLTENENCSKLTKEFIDVYTKIIKTKKIKQNSKNLSSLLGSDLSKNLELVIGSVKQFSNNFFKIGFFKPIHSIFFDIFRLIDTYKVEDIANIIINGILFYIMHSNILEKNNITAPKIITYGVTNNLSALGFINTPSPFLPKLTPEKENNTYTLVLDLDETLVHFFYTPSGGTFLIRPYCFQFLSKMSKYFETVIFTAAMKEYADSILDLIDPNKKLIKFRLYRYHTTISGINFVKDLSKLGRDLNKTIIVDNLADNFKLQQNNGIQIGTWIDDMKDTQLNDLGKILVEIVNKNPQNIRNIIKKLKEDCNKKMRKNINSNPFKEIDTNKYFK